MQKIKVDVLSYEHEYECYWICCPVAIFWLTVNIVQKKNLLEKFDTSDARFVAWRIVREKKVGKMYGVAKCWKKF